MSKRYMVTRERHQLEAISLFADSKEDAIEQSRKKLKADWNVLDDQRKTGYAAKRVRLSGERAGSGTAEPTINGHS